MEKDKARARHGILLVDKPEGPTSHDVVARVKRLLSEKRVGHAGTLDPLASGLLVVLVGEGTKLAPFLDAHRKRYQARVRLGRTTNTLDRAGETTEEKAVPEALRKELLETARTLCEGPLLRAALELERKRTLQVPPSFSAIKSGGKRSYELARKGQTLELPPRPVDVGSLGLIGCWVSSEFIEFEVELEVSKGYYVRSFAADVARALDTVGYITKLRRTESGPFLIANAVAVEGGDPSKLAAHVIPLALAAAQTLPSAELTPEGEARARVGKGLTLAHFVSPPLGSPSAWLSAQGNSGRDLIAVGTDFREQDGCAFRVLRGFSTHLSEEDREGDTETGRIS